MSIKAQLGNYNVDELQKYIAKELEENAIKTADQEKKFMEFLASFKSSRYSARNQFMLFIQSWQNEYLPIFGTWDEWKEKGTSVKQGEKGMTICRPIFSEVYYENVERDGKPVEIRYIKFMTPQAEQKRLEEAVKNGTARKENELTSFTYIDSAFSMSQTNMTEADRIEYLQRYNAANTSEENAELYEKLIEVAGALGRTVEEKDIKDESLGWVERLEGVNLRADAPQAAQEQASAKAQELLALEGKKASLSEADYVKQKADIDAKYKGLEKWIDGAKIVIKKDMPIDAKISVLAHEIGHKLLHIQNATAANRPQKEVQAQLFSHLAMLKFGIDAEKQFSLSYINNWINNAENKYPPLFDKNGRELSRGEVLQINLMTVIPAVDVLMQTVGEKLQPIDKDDLKKLQAFSVGEKLVSGKPVDKLKENKVEIEPLRIFNETDKAVLVKLEGERTVDKKAIWLPKSQISTNKEGFVYEATPSIIQSKGLTAKAALKTAATARRR